LASAWAKIADTHLATLAIGVGAIVILLALQKLAPRWPRALIVVATSTLLVWGLGLHEHGVAIVGDVPAGLPRLSLPTVDLQASRELIGVALAIALVGFMESIAVAKRYARDLSYEVDANKELVGLGLANVVGSFAGAYPVTGGFSRTAVNAQAGAATNVAGLITASLIGVTLLLLTPLFHFLPKAVLAAIIMTAVFGLIDLAEVRHLWKVKRTDLVLLGLTFGTTLLVGIEPGIATGVVTSLAVLVFKSTRPHVAVLGRIAGTREYRNLDRFADARPKPGTLAVRIDAQLYFGNVNFLKETLDALERQHGPVSVVVIDASGINQIDSSGETTFREILDGYKKRGVAMRLANVKGPVRDVLSRSGFIDELGSENLFLSVFDAMVGDEPER
jgi:SulP family sulfate permease